MAFLPPLPRGSNQIAKISSHPLLNGTGFETNSWHSCGDRPSAPCNRPSRAGLQPSFTYALPSAAVCDRCSGSPWQMVPKMGLLAGCTTCRPPITHTDVRANTRLSARLCSKGTCLGLQVTPGARFRGHAWSPRAMPLSLRPFGVWPPDRAWAHACPQAQLSTTSVLRPRVPSLVLTHEHGSFLGPPARALRWAWTKTTQARWQRAKVTGPQMQKLRRALVPPSVPRSTALYTWDGEATKQGLLRCGPAPKCTGGLVFVKEQDKSVPQCQGEQGLSAHSWERARRK